MVTELTEELRLDDGSGRLFDVPGAPMMAFISNAARKFPFQLCRKQAVMGDLKVDQWWMDRRTLYGERGRKKANHAMIVDYWWSRCMKEGKVFQDEVHESYILAKLLPYARSNGSRRVFGDAVPTRKKIEGISVQKATAELDDILATSRDMELDKHQFYLRTADCLGPPEFEPEIVEAYEQLTAEFFGKALPALQRDGTEGLSVAIQDGEARMKSIGRRRGHQVEKWALDMLSYMCRAAFHQCYSLVWCDLLRHLKQKYEMDDHSFAFHRLWHLAQREPSNRDDCDFHLFHGHILALHSAAGNLINTKTGGELMAAWLKEAGDGTAFRRLLHGLLVAIHHYAVRNQIYALLRKKSPQFLTDEGLDYVERDSSETGRRRRPTR